MISIPPSSRESVFVAMHGLLSTLQPSPFVTVSRKLKMWNDVPAELQPALYITDHSEIALNPPRGLPTKSTWNIMLFIYAKVDEFTVGSTVLNNLLDAVDRALKTDVSTNVLTLGGLVYRVDPQGEIRKDPGDLDGQAIALYPFAIRPP